MSVQDVDRRLDDRFALLRGGDQSKPDRHQTLLAVIDWSWNLLAEDERRALRWLSVFHDGFTLEGAGTLLGAYWTITGENPRVIALATAVDEALAGWEPDPQDIDTAVTAAAMVVMNTVVGEFAETPVCLALLDTHGDRATDERTRGIVAVLSAQRSPDLDTTIARLRELGDGPDRYAAMQALMWLAHYLENNGDPEASIEYGARALERCTPDDGPSFPALLRTILGLSLIHI